MFGSITTSIEHIRTGTLRALAVTTTDRCHTLPDVPPLCEALPDFEISTWFGLAAPRHTPEAIIERLNTLVGAGLNDPVVRSRLATLGASPMACAPAGFDAFLTTEVGPWRQLVRSIG